MDHEYEVLDKYNELQEYEVIQSSASSAKQSSTGDYELTPCPAYGTVSARWNNL